MKLKCFFSALISSTVFAAVISPCNISAQNSQSDNNLFDVPEYIKQAADFSNVARITELGQDDLNSITCENRDGTFTTLEFMEPIKYFDNVTNSFNYIDNKLTKASDSEWAFESSGNSFKCKFSNCISDGILIEDDNYSVKFSTISTNFEGTPKLGDNTIVYNDVYRDGVDVEYQLTNTGIKEKVILDQYKDFSSYTFSLDLDGLEISNFCGEQIFLSDLKTGENVLSIDPTYIVDSTGENVSFNNYYTVESISSSSYLVTVNLDDKFLKDEKTQYPCVIDPTVHYLHTETISGSYATQSGSTLSNNYFQVGSFNGTGECITYLKVNGLEDKKWINPNNILESEISFKDCSDGYYNSGTITCYDSNNIYNISNVSYSQLVSSLGTTVDSKPISDANSYYSFNITYLMKKWLSHQIGQGGFTYDFGCVFRGDSNLVGRKAYKYDPNNNYNPYITIWYINDEIIEDGIYKISSAYNHSYIQNNDVYHDVTAESTLYSTIDKWKIVNTGDGKYTIQPYNNSTQYLYVSATNSGYKVQVWDTEFKWYIIKNYSGTYRIMPASSTSISTAIRYNNEDVELYAYNNNSTSNWEITPVYQATVNNYYDMGYPVRYGETETVSQSVLNGYMNDLNKRYMEIFGLNIINNGAEYYNSIVDTCKGTVTDYNIDSICLHTADHTDADNIAYDFYTHYAGSDLLTNIYWTGHKVTSDIGINRSFSLGTSGIYMLELCSASNRTFNSESVLMHELNHQYGAPDHYHEILPDGSCRGGIYCSYCGVNPRPYTCIMRVGRTDITNEDVICYGCKGDMLVHLENHHVN